MERNKENKMRKRRRVRGRKEEKLTGKQSARRRFYQRHELAPKIHERFPEVLKIELKLTRQLDAGTPFPDYPETFDKTYEADRKVLFWFECAARDCEEGAGKQSGHDITEVIKSAIMEGKETFSGLDICQGWQDFRRVGLYHCLCRLRFEGKITYKD